MKEREALFLELLCCELYAVSVGDFELDADLRYRPINRPFRRSKAGVFAFAAHHTAVSITTYSLR